MNYAVIIVLIGHGGTRRYSYSVGLINIDEAVPKC